MQEYRGSYIMSFAGYNAGRGRVQKWTAQYGDPRDPKVDAIDWVERIPFAETRNYVQRVMENLQLYRVRFSETNPTFPTRRKNRMNSMGAYRRSPLQGGGRDASSCCCCCDAWVWLWRQIELELFDQ